AFRRGGGDIDIVDADTGAADDLQAMRVFENVLGDLGRAADGETVISADDGFELVGRFASDFVDLDAALPEDKRGPGIHFVADEDFYSVGHFKPLHSRESENSVPLRS